MKNLLIRLMDNIISLSKKQVPINAGTKNLLNNLNNKKAEVRL